MVEVGINFVCNIVGGEIFLGHNFQLIGLSECRCLGILLQKVHDRTYVRAKIDLMYEQADITLPVNRLGLAKAMGLVITL